MYLILFAEGEKFEPPVFIQELQDMEVDDGDTVELNVEVKGKSALCKVERLCMECGLVCDFCVVFRGCSLTFRL